MAREPLLKRLREQGVGELLWELVRGYLIPALGTAVTALAGVLQGLPAMYVVLGALGGFALTAHGLAKVGEWRRQRSVDDKLAFGMAPVQHQVVPPDPRARGIKIGFRLKNNAEAPIHVRITKLKTSFGNRHPTESVLPSETVKLIPTTGALTMYDAAIDVADIDLAGKVFMGTLEVTANYGPGRLKYTLEIKKNVEMIFGPDGRVMGQNASNAPSVVTG